VATGEVVTGEVVTGEVVTGDVLTAVSDVDEVEGSASTPQAPSKTTTSPAHNVLLPSPTADG